MELITATVMKLSAVCPLCKKENSGSWATIEVESRKKRVCEECCKNFTEKSKLDTSFFDKAKKRQEEERKAKNAQVLRSYRIKT